MWAEMPFFEDLKRKHGGEDEASYVTGIDLVIAGGFTV